MSQVALMIILLLSAWNAHCAFLNPTSGSTNTQGLTHGMDRYHSRAHTILPRLMIYIQPLGSGVEHACPPQTKYTYSQMHSSTFQD